MKDLTHLSLFSGIGGLDLAAEWAGIRTVGQCEWAEYPTAVLEKHWPDVPRWKDIRTLTGESFYERTGRRTVDVISGGFPCQPFSVAGKQRGTEDDRYLWPEMVRVIKELRPAWIVGENVAGIIKMALPDILSELEACGYRARTFLIPACAVGARHRRYRVAIVAHTGHHVLPGREREEERGERAACHEPAPCSGGIGAGDLANAEGGGKRGIPVQQGEESADPDRRSKDVADAKSIHPGRLPVGTREEEPRSSGGRKDEQHASGRREPESGMGGMADGLPGWVDGYWDTEPDIPRIARGIPNRIERLKALGNAVVPQQFYPVFKAIADIEMQG